MNEREKKRYIRDINALKLYKHVDYLSVSECRHFLARIERFGRTNDKIAVLENKGVDCTEQKKRQALRLKLMQGELQFYSNCNLKLDICGIYPCIYDKNLNNLHLLLFD